MVDLITYSKNPYEDVCVSEVTFKHSPVNVCNSACASVKCHKPIFAPRGASTLLSVNNVPESLRRDFILTGYRQKPLCSTWKDTLLSFFYIHNETGNIYTHGVAFVVISALATYHFGFSGFDNGTPGYSVRCDPHNNYSSCVHTVEAAYDVHLLYSADLNASKWLSKRIAAFSGLHHCLSTWAQARFTTVSTVTRRASSTSPIAVIYPVLC